MPPKWGAKLRQAALKAREGGSLKSRIASGHATGQSFRVARAELSNRSLATVEEGVEGIVQGTNSRRTSQDSTGRDARRSQLKGGTFRSREAMAMNSQRMGGRSQRSLVAATQASHISKRSHRSLLGAMQADRKTEEDMDKVAHLEPKASRRFRRAFTAIKHMKTFRTLSGHLKQGDSNNGKEIAEPEPKSRVNVRRLRFLPKTKQELVKVRRRLDETIMKEGGSQSAGKAANRLFMDDLAETLTEVMPSVSKSAARKMHVRKLNKVRLSQSITTWRLPI